MRKSRKLLLVSPLPAGTLGVIFCPHNMNLFAFYGPMRRTIGVQMPPAHIANALCSQCPYFCKNPDATQKVAAEGEGPERVKAKEVWCSASKNEYPYVVISEGRCAAGHTLSSRTTLDIEAYPQAWVLNLHSNDIQCYAWKHEKRFLFYPYLLANVYESGEVCWGSVVRPRDLASAVEKYWLSDFNKDLTYTEKPLLEHLSTWQPKPTASPLSLLPEGKPYMAIEGGADALLIDWREKTLASVPEAYHRILADKPAIAGWVRNCSEGVLITIQDRTAQGEDLVLYKKSPSSTRGTLLGTKASLKL